MKIACILLTCLLSLPLFIGCGDTEELLDSLDSPILIQELPTDDDIAGLYNLGVPWDWYNVKNPVLYTKYFRAKLLREFGNAPEIHVIADMELKIRQRTYPVLDERITYLEAIYKLWPDEGILADLEYQRRARADGEPLVVIYGDDQRRI
ncbi:MAG: hypothetical protein OXU36_03200 [Candidatus Poribacteria bacterium]|nr:hypothetical protein [Candidatus Poribacteria bacterium]